MIREKTAQESKQDARDRYERLDVTDSAISQDIEECMSDQIGAER